MGEKDTSENDKKFLVIWNSGWYLYSFFGNTGLEFGINEDGVTNHCNWNAMEETIKSVDVVNTRARQIISKMLCMNLRNVWTGYREGLKKLQIVY